MELTKRITDAYAEANRISNWDEPHFDWSKAYVASVFAKIAYLHIPQYELKNTNRANLIPCVEYREIIQGPGNIGTEQFPRNSDFGEFFIVEKPYAVAVVIKVQTVLFISLRGSQKLYDWLVNLNATKSRPYTNVDADIYFHRGFHHVAANCMHEIHSEILKRFGRDSTIYVTGHSLGGALAAILHALWSRCHMHYRLIGYNPRDEYLTTHSCYTFGMPRYGNFHAVQHFASPFHIYNQSDIVPTVPPKSLGFDDCPIEYCLTADGKVDRSNLKGSSFSQFIFRLATLKGIREHDMEIYISRTNSVRNVT
jgi:hypothetical protein